MTSLTYELRREIKDAINAHKRATWNKAARLDKELERYRKRNAPVETCPALIKEGKRKGTVCGNRARANGYCGQH